MDKLRVYFWYDVLDMPDSNDILIVRIAPTGRSQVLTPSLAGGAY